MKVLLAIAILLFMLIVHPAVASSSNAAVQQAPSLMTRLFPTSSQNVTLPEESPPIMNPKTPSAPKNWPPCGTMNIGSSYYDLYPITSQNLKPSYPPDAATARVMETRCDYLNWWTGCGTTSFNPGTSYDVGGSIHKDDDNTYTFVGLANVTLCGAIKGEQSGSLIYVHFPVWKKDTSTYYVVLNTSDTSGVDWCTTLGTDCVYTYDITTPQYTTITTTSTTSSTTSSTT